MPWTSRAAMIAVVGAVVSTASAPARAQVIDLAEVELRTEQIAPHVYTLTGSPGADPFHPEATGGRIGVLEGPDGIFMVDAQYAPLADKVLAAVKAINPAPIRFVVNTHGHYDHTGGNAALAKAGAVVIAAEDARGFLLRPPPSIAGGLVPPIPAGLPVMTLGAGASVKIRMDGDVIDLTPLLPAHTGGDVVVRFEKADVIMVGDVYRNYGYPFADLANGGSVNGILQATDMILAIAGPNTKLVPGHGDIVNREALKGYRDLILAVQGRVQRMIDQGATLDQVLASKVTAPFDATTPGGLDPVARGATATTADRFVSAVYAELTRRKGG